MKFILNADAMRRCDETAVRDFGIPGAVLMENAARGAADIARALLAGTRAPHVLVVCGRGNNGGDGFAVARHLANAGMTVEVRLLHADDDITGDARLNLDILRRMEDGSTVSIARITDAAEMEAALLHRPDLLVDAILGTGLSAPVTGLAAGVITAMNASGIRTLALDIPSGISADDGEEMGVAVQAAATATMGALKPGLLIRRGRACAGEVHLVDIGMPRAVYERNRANTFQLEEREMLEAIPRRAFDAHKYQMGKVFVLAGSPGMTGAAAMASETALRTGAGIVRLGIPVSLNTIMEVKLTEVMTVPLKETAEQTLSMGDFERILNYVNTSTVTILGPGISRNYETQTLVRKLVTHSEAPMVLDADALFALVGHPDLLLQARVPLVLTPHAGEFSRFTGLTADDIERDRIELARIFAMENQVTLVLKGAPTVIATPRGDAFVNPTGNPGMATAGSGDVLTGIIGGLIAQGASITQGACGGVYLHGLAGDLAVQRVGQQGMISSDIIRGLGEYFAESFEAISAAR